MSVASETTVNRKLEFAAAKLLTTQLALCFAAWA
jgi:hypothetical protein